MEEVKKWVVRRSVRDMIHLQTEAVGVYRTITTDGARGEVVMDTSMSDNGVVATMVVGGRGMVV